MKRQGSGDSDICSHICVFVDLFVSHLLSEKKNGMKTFNLVYILPMTRSEKFFYKINVMMAECVVFYLQIILCLWISLSVSQPLAKRKIKKMVQIFFSDP